MNETCGIAMGRDEMAESGRVICGKPAVDWADIYDNDGNWFRIFYCAEHLHLREQTLAMHGGSRLPFDPFQ